MSYLQDLKTLCPDLKAFRHFLEEKGMQEYIAMSTKRNEPFWGEFKDPETGLSKLGFEVNPDAVDYHYEDLSEEEINEAVEILYYS